jgi:hypothetical protein
MTIRFIAVLLPLIAVLLPLIAVLMPRGRRRPVNQYLPLASTDASFPALAGEHPEAKAPPAVAPSEFRRSNRRMQHE